MHQKELTKTFIMISSVKKPLWFPWFIQKYFSDLKANVQQFFTYPKLPKFKAPKFSVFLYKTIINILITSGKESFCFERTLPR